MYKCNLRVQVDLSGTGCNRSSRYGAGEFPRLELGPARVGLSDTVSFLNLALTALVPERIESFSLVRFPVDALLESSGNATFRDWERLSSALIFGGLPCGHVPVQVFRTFPFVTVSANCQEQFAYLRHASCFMVSDPQKPRLQVAGDTKC